MPLPPATAFRPLPVRFANAVLPGLWRRRILPPADLDADGLFAMAERQTGLRNYDPLGDDGAFWRAQLTVLLASLAGEARLNAIGLLIAHGSILKVLKERLWAADLFRRHPEILAEELAAPLVIVGPMRSGTTRLQRLLASDPAFGGLRLFEAMCPVPWPGSFRASVDPRLTYTARGLRALNWINPGNAATHPTGPLQVDEELGLLEASFAGAQIEAQRRVPTFARMGEAIDQTPAYRHLCRLLQLRQWFTGDRRPLVLKTPQHMQDLAALNAVFPDARLIFLSRDPVAVVASSASMVWNQMVVQSDEVDPAWIGAEWLHKTAFRRRAAARDRAIIDPARTLDTSFDTMNADWRGEIARIYAWLGRDPGPAWVEMEAYLSRATAHRAHAYRLSDFGLIAEQVNDVT